MISRAWAPAEIAERAALGLKKLGKVARRKYGIKG
jgi:hypothetical protein